MMTDIEKHKNWAGGSRHYDDDSYDQESCDGNIYIGIRRANKGFENDNSRVKLSVFLFK